MYEYEKYSFVNTDEMFRKAYEGGYAIPAFNYVNLEQMLAIVEACIETRSPFILQSSANVNDYIGPLMVRRMAQACAEIIAQSGTNIPMALNLDHGVSLKQCTSCIENGFSSVMIDGSMLAYEENVALTKSVVDYAKVNGVTVEGELGVLSGTEEDIMHAENKYTDPALAEDFVKRTGVNSLAISIGTSHGVFKLKVKKGEPLAPLRFDILEEIQDRLPGFPIVLHGSSAIPPYYVEMLNKYGGKLEQAQGIPVEQIKQAVKTAVCKINIASDGYIAATATIRKVLSENPSVIDPRKYMGPARDEMKRLYMSKTLEIFDSAGKA